MRAIRFILIRKFRFPGRIEFKKGRSSFNYGILNKNVAVEKLFADGRYTFSVKTFKIKKVNILTEKNLTYQDLPNTVKYGLGFLFSGWLIFLLALYVFLGSYDFLKFLIALGILGYYIIRIRNWARVLGLLFNVIGIFYCTVSSLAFLLRAANFWGSFLFLIVVVLMGASTYYLMKKESSGFYKIHTPRLPKKTSEKEKNV